jgi:hypothetical protein
MKKREFGTTINPVKSKANFCEIRRVGVCT